VSGTFRFRKRRPIRSSPLTTSFGFGCGRANGGVYAAPPFAILLGTARTSACPKWAGTRHKTKPRGAIRGNGGRVASLLIVDPESGERFLIDATRGSVRGPSPRVGVQRLTI